MIYEEIADDDIKLIVAASSILLNQFYNYFDKLNISLDDVFFWGRPEGFDCLWDIYKRGMKVFESRQLEFPEEIIRIKPEMVKG